MITFNFIVGYLIGSISTVVIDNVFLHKMLCKFHKNYHDAYIRRISK